MSVRIQRVQEFLKQEIGQILLTEMNDPRLRFVSVTRVEVSADLREAKVFVSALQSDTKLATIMEALGHARGHIQALVSPRLSTRFAPKLHFHFDPGLRQSVELSRLIDAALAEDAGLASGEATPKRAPHVDARAADIDAGLA